ncbi:tyrosine kinase receptor Cad96Ca [Chelonus insularis]|uniref:tyrosine kinase receptor Cad96Ca n=1 Tax=Chelonus insularis TaxID=460826 RepID=UPI00158BF626|nr:tyrosine kinase receptor Cad96Ca [Chelonus insularis]
MFVKWITVIVATIFCTTSRGQMSDNTPPVMRLDRNWILSDSESVGTIVTRVHARDNEQSKLIYGLEPIDHSYGVDTSSQFPLPFSINNETGVVYINETLKGRGGQNLYLYVTVSDGQLTAKTEVFVNIKNGSAINSENAGPSLSHQHGSDGRVHPPFLVLANSPYTRQPPSQISTTNLTSGKKITTLLFPEKNDTNENATIKLSTTSISSIDRKSNNFNEPVLVNEVKPNIGKNENTETTIGTTSYQEITMKIIPIAAICALFLGLGMGIWSVRARFCNNHRKSQDISKEQSVVGLSTMSNGPSLILKNWDKSKSSNNKYQEWSKESKIHGNQSTKQINDKWEFPRHRLKVFNILGEGCFGQVWKCEALDIDGKQGPTVVAVKTLKKNATERERLDLAQELNVMKTLEPHPNVVRLLGCCTEQEPLFVILEYVCGGKLQSFLRTSREERNRGGPGLTSSDLTGFVYQVAKGMEFLASKGIIHRDLAARNILIDNNRVCKVADFGFARDIAANKIYERKSEGRLPIRWMAPESLYDNIFSVKSDIWSFGVLIWEIVTLGSTPYPGMAAADVMRKIKDGYRLERPEHCKRELYNIMYYCWDKDPNCRPTFSELVIMAEGLLLDETDYIELDRFPDHSYYNVLNLSGEKL